MSSHCFLYNLLLRPTLMGNFYRKWLQDFTSFKWEPLWISSAVVKGYACCCCLFLLALLSLTLHTHTHTITSTQWHMLIMAFKKTLLTSKRQHHPCFIQMTGPPPMATAGQNNHPIPPLHYPLWKLPLITALANSILSSLPHSHSPRLYMYMYLTALSYYWVLSLIDCISPAGSGPG